MEPGAVIAVVIAVGAIGYFIDLFIKEKHSNKGNGNAGNAPTLKHSSSNSSSGQANLGQTRTPVVSQPYGWEALRQRVITRDGNKCTMCHATINLQVDHIQELSLGGTNALSNLRTLCVSCHEERHGRIFTRYEYYTDRRYGENYQLNPKVAALLEAENSGIGIKYKDRNARYSERVIYPKRIWSDPKTQRIYVTAYDELDEDKRHFKLSRMKLIKSRLNFYEDGGTDKYSDVNPDWMARNQL